MNTKVPVLIDFDGVIKLGNKIADDAEVFFTFLRQNSIPFFLISNSTLRTSEDMIDFLKSRGLNADIPSMTAVDATLSYVKEHYKRVSVYCRPNIKSLFSEFDTDSNPEAVVLGDIADKWTYKTMNEIFRKVYNGADIIAMHKNRYWEPDGKTLTMDAGAFITAIEYAASKESILIGKPSPIYFNTALKDLGFDPGSIFIMIGDDLESDITAAQDIGGKGILIYTGKTKFPLPDNLKYRPEFEAKSLTEVIVILLESLGQGD
jgi:HAD superfamily hydrolase (TIGR01458 family)